jgi:hypothetical protein
MATTFHPHSQGHQGKISKYKARHTVKPILKKLHSAHSEKNSLDLDRNWEEQQSPQLGYTNYGGNQDSDGSAGLSGFASTSSSQSQTQAQSHSHAYQPSSYSPTSYNGRGTRDVSFDLSLTDLPRTAATITATSTNNSTSATSASSSTPATTPATSSSNNVTVTTPSNSSSKFPYHHARSTSGASQFSVATTNSGRNGSFVHPFQQTPRTSSPPLLSYSASLASLDNNNNQQRDYSPTIITENEDDQLDPLGPPVSTTNTSAARVSHQPHSSHHRRPSLAGSHRVSTLSDAAPPRAAGGRKGSGSAPRLVTVNTTSSTASALNHTRSTDASYFSAATPSVTVIDDSPLSAVTTATMGISPQMSTNTSASVNPMSPLRSSLDMNNFRIRSRSDVDTATRQEHVRAARRKFEEKEKAKEEKYAREQVRKRERADTKEAHRLEKAQSRTKGTYSARNSTSAEARPSLTRKSTSHSRADEHDETPSTSPIDSNFGSRVYDDMEPGRSPSARADDVHFESSKRSRATKRKSAGTWTAFVLWFRTRLLKLGRR